MAKSLLYSNTVPVTDKINIIIPTVGDIIENEDDYYGAVASITANQLNWLSNK